MSTSISHALVRPPPPSFAEGLTSVALGVPDYRTALEQHAAYVAAIKQTGINVIELPPLNDFPDSCFVEDTAVLIEDAAIAMRPGSPKRRGEVPLLMSVLSDYVRPIGGIDAEGMLDGGDVLEMDRRLFVGLTQRTNALGVEQLRTIVAPRGYEVTAVEVQGMLHLKTGSTRLGTNIVTARRSLAAALTKAGLDVLEVPEHEAYAANCLRINDHLLMARGFPETQALIREAKLVPSNHVIEVEMSEFAKQDGGLTCLSRLW
ncbi:MAG: hypothetical protein R3C68_01555 [Myxococcota bacterium]